MTALVQDAGFLSKIAECEDNRFTLLHFRDGAVGCPLDRGGNGLHLLLNLCGQRLCLAGAPFRRLSQCSDFVGDNGEAASVIAGAGRLDSGIECE